MASAAIEFLAVEIGPPGLLLWAAILYLLFACRGLGRLIGVGLLTASFGIVPYVLGLPLVATDLDAKAARERLQDPPGDVVIALGAGVFDAKEGGFWPTENSLYRTSAAASLAGYWSVPLIVSGGLVRAELAAEAEVVVARMNLPDNTVIENEARNTAENASFSKAVMERNGWKRAVIVTSPSHTRRAAAAFRSAGVELAAVVKSADEARADWKLFVPSPRGLRAWRGVLYEYAGLAMYWLSGRIHASSLFGH